MNTRERLLDAASSVRMQFWVARFVLKVLTIVLIQVFVIIIQVALLAKQLSYAGVDVIIWSLALLLALVLGVALDATVSSKGKLEDKLNHAMADSFKKMVDSYISDNEIEFSSVQQSIYNRHMAQIGKLIIHGSKAGRLVGWY